MHDSLPNAELAVVPESKVTGYLLSESHPDGRGKARFFMRHGFKSAEPETLIAALRRHAVGGSVVNRAETEFGGRYVVDGILHTPDGRDPRVRTVWFLGPTDPAPRLVTAYPIR